MDPKVYEKITSRKEISHIYVEAANNNNNNIVAGSHYCFPKTVTYSPSLSLSAQTLAPLSSIGFTPEINVYMTAHWEDFEHFQTLIYKSFYHSC